MAYRSSTTGSGSNSFTIAGTAPAGVTAGDRLYAIISIDQFLAGVIPPAGSAWRQIAFNGNPPNSPDTSSLQIYEIKNATGSESYTFTCDYSAHYTIHCVAFSGRSNVAPASIGSTQNWSYNSPPITIPLNGVIAGSGDDLIAATQLDKTVLTSVWTISAATGFTDRESSSDPALWIASEVQTKDNVSAGATGAITVTATTGAAASSGYSGFVINVPPSSWTPPTPTDITGKGDSFNSWAIKRKSNGRSSTSLLYQSVQQGDLDTTEKTIWNDWFFDASASIELFATVQNTTTAIASLTTGIPLSSTSSASVNSTGNITTGISLSSVNTNTVSVTGSLTTSISLSGSASAVVTTLGNLSGSATALNGSAQSIVTLTSNLTTSITVAMAATAVVAVSASLTTGKSLSGAYSAVSSSTANLTTSIKLNSSAQSVVSATSVLGNFAALTGSCQSVASSTESLTTAIRFTNNSASVASASSTMTTQIKLGSSAIAQAIATSDLFVGMSITWSSNSYCTATSTALLTNETFLDRFTEMNQQELIDMTLEIADRQDANLVNLMPSFIRMVENRINNVIKLETSSSRLSYVTNPTDGRYVLPIDFMNLTEIFCYPNDSKSSTTTYQLVNPEQMNVASYSGFGGPIYCIVANKLNIFPILDDTYTLEIVYNARIVPLLLPENTNWLSNYNPNAYIFGLLVEISAYVKDSAAAQMWDNRFKEAIEELNAVDHEYKTSGTPLQIRIG